MAEVVICAFPLLKSTVGGNINFFKTGGVVSIKTYTYILQFMNTLQL
jgi:hypothetical protein